MKKSAKFLALAFCSLVVLATTGSSCGSSSNQPTVSSADSSVASSNQSTSSNESSSAEAVAHIGEYSQNDELKITLKSVKEYTTVENSESSYLNTDAADGKKIVILTFEAENISNKDEYVNMFYFSAYCDDMSVDMKTLLYYPDGMKLFSGDLAAGKKLQGSVAYEVPKDWKKLEFYYSPTGGTKLAFSVENSEVEKVN